MTSIEWLIDQIKEYDFAPHSNNEEYVIVMPKWIFDAKTDEAKLLHKQEIIDAVDSNFTYSTNEYPTLGEQYYHKTFVSKGSDETSDFDKPFMDFAKQYVEQLKSKGSDQAPKCTCNVDSFLCQIHGTSDGKTITAF